MLAAVTIHVLAVGYWGLRAVGYRTESFLARLVSLIGFGFVGFEFEVWGLGHLHGLTRTTLLCSTAAAGMALLLANFRRIAIRELLSSAAGRIRQERILAGAMVILCIVVAMSVRGTGFEDDYKWKSPRLWAAAGAWVRSPLRISNGMEATEVLFTFPAVFNSWTAAHWTHALLWALLLTSVAALRRESAAIRWRHRRCRGDSRRIFASRHCKHRHPMRLAAGGRPGLRHARQARHGRRPDPATNTDRRRHHPGRGRLQ